MTLDMSITLSVAPVVVLQVVDPGKAKGAEAPFVLDDRCGLLDVFGMSVKVCENENSCLANFGHTIGFVIPDDKFSTGISHGQASSQKSGLSPRSVLSEKS